MKIYCMKCEAENDEVAAFCSSCGNALKGRAEVGDGRSDRRWSGSKISFGMSFCALSLAAFACVVALSKEENVSASTEGGVSELAGRIAALEERLGNGLTEVAAGRGIVSSEVDSGGSDRVSDSPGTVVGREELQEAIERAMVQVANTDVPGSELRRRYFEDLASGNLFMLSAKSQRHITLAIASYLSDVEVESWEAVALAFTDELIAKGVDRWERNKCQSTVEAVYNMTANGELKAKAHVAWQLMEQQRYTRAKMSYDDSVARVAAARREGKTTTFRGTPPWLRKIRVWSDEDEEVGKAGP